MTQVVLLVGILVGLCLASPALAYDEGEPDHFEAFDTLYGYDDILSKRDAGVADNLSGETTEYGIEDFAGPGYDDFYSGGIGMSYYDGYFEDEAPADCTEGENGQYIVDGPICDVNITGADAFLAKLGLEKAAKLDGTWKVAGCKNGLPRYTLVVNGDAEARELWFSTVFEAWVFGGSATEEEAQGEAHTPLLFSLDASTRPNFVRPGDWARDFQSPVESDIRVSCANSAQLEDPISEVYDDDMYDALEYQEGGFWEEAMPGAEAVQGGEFYGGDFYVGGGDDGAYAEMEELADEARLVEVEVDVVDDELPADFQSVYESGLQGGTRDTIRELPGRRNRKLSSN